MNRNPDLPPDLLEQVESFEEAEDQLQLIQELRILVDNAMGNEHSYKILDHLWTVCANEQIARFLSEREIVALTIHLLLARYSDSRLTQLCIGLLANLSSMFTSSNSLISIPRARNGDWQPSRAETEH